MAYEIEDGVPLPLKASANKGASKYPFADMRVGQSFFVPDGKVDTVSGYSSRAGASLGRKFSIRTVEGGVRVWRVA